MSLSNYYDQAHCGAKSALEKSSVSVAGHKKPVWAYIQNILAAVGLIYLLTTTAAIVASVPLQRAKRFKHIIRDIMNRGAAG